MAEIQRARRIPNAHGQVLIENWVEERATEQFDHPEYATATSPLSPTSVKKTSHTALLTPHYASPLGRVTTYRDNFDQFGPFEQIEQGARRKRLEQTLTRQVAAELRAQHHEHEEQLRQQRIDDSTSEYQSQYKKEFQSKPLPTTQVHHRHTYEDASSSPVSRRTIFHENCPSHSGRNIDT
jgi:hypothetical protein